MGTSKKKYHQRCLTTDHPHAYGDKFRTGCRVHRRRGSSPRVWGQVLFLDKISSGKGIIPTRMGTSSSSVSISCLRRDHPHAYGDKAHLRYLMTTTVGSSPRVWGQVNNPSEYRYSDRIIPTRMGTRYLQPRTEVRAWDHPHAYGDKPSKFKPVFSDKGSSPRVWGQVMKVTEAFDMFRIIPTRMGTRTTG